MFKATLALMLCGFVSLAQKNLVLHANQVGHIKSNVHELSLDTLVMKDSSMLVFSGRKNMYLFVNHMVVGKGCIFEGSGGRGRNGDMLPYTGNYVSRREPTIRGEGGSPGSPGTNLYITVKNLILEDTLTIHSPGGTGGNGNVVPILNVFSSRPGVATQNYFPSNPYNGLPGLGGNGGRGGNVIIAYSPAIEEHIGRIAVLNPGGEAGQMGDINPMNLIPQPMSVLDPQARLNDPRFVRKARTEGKAGKVKLMKLKE